MTSKISFVSALRNAEEILASTVMVLMCASTFINVVGRNVFNSPVSWAEELSRYSFIWLVFIGAALCTKHRAHINIDGVVVALPLRWQRVATMATDVATAVLMLVLIYYGTVLMLGATQLTSTLRIPTYIVYAAVPISAILILIRTFVDLKRNLTAVLKDEDN